MECVHNFWGTCLNRWGTVHDHCRQHQRKRKHKEGVKALTQVSEKCVSVDSLVLIVAKKRHACVLANDHRGALQLVSKDRETVAMLQ